MSSVVFERLRGALSAVGRRRWTRLIALLLALAAVRVWTEKPGLEARYYAHPEDRLVLVRTDDWMVVDRLANSVFYTTHLFRVEWSGWLDLARGGPHALRFSASGPVAVEVDGVEVPIEKRRGGKSVARLRHLEPGLHRLQLRFDHNGPNVRFQAEFREGRDDFEAFPIRRLYDRRPGAVRRAMRDALGGFDTVDRKLLAAAILLAGLLVWSLGAGGPSAPREPSRLVAWASHPRRRGWLAGAGLAVLFTVAAAAILPRIGSPFGWDDVRYLDIAAFNRNITWVLNRYAHVYLLDFFIWLSGGDAFLGARIFWAAQFGLIVCCFATSAAALGPRLQLGTFFVSLFFLFCQPLFFLRAGASLPDATVGTLVMLAVALYLHRWRRGPTPLEWQILAIGAITVWAFKSKELGIILLWLPVLFAFENGRLDWRGLVRKGLFWLAGVAVGILALMVFDWMYFGDPLYGLRPHYMQQVSRFNFAPHPQQGRALEGWMDVVREGRTPVATNNPHMGYMGLVVIAAAFLAGWKRRSIELRLLHLLPVLYLLMLMLIHVRATYVFLSRYLYPVVPVSCFLAAAGFHYLGLDELERREVRSPRFLVPAVALGFLIAAIVIPYQTGWISAAEFLPAEWLRSIDWYDLDVFVHLVAAPTLVLSVVLALAVFQRHRPTRLLLSATLVLLFLGVPFFRTVWEMRTRIPWQRGETNLHGLRVLGDQIPATEGAWLNVSLNLTRNEKMFGARPTCERIVRVFVKRRDLRITCWPAVLPEHDAVFLGRAEYDGWLQAWPGLEDTATLSPGGELVLVRPSQAGEPPPSYYE